MPHYTPLSSIVLFFLTSYHFYSSIQVSGMAGVREGTQLPNRKRGRGGGFRNVNNPNIMLPA